MPVRPCPKCHKSTARSLEESSKQAGVNYYRCDYCGHVWTTPKVGPVEPSDITFPQTTRTLEAARQLHLRMIRTEIASACGFLRSAQSIHDRQGEKRFLDFARRCHDNAKRLLDRTAMESALRQEFNSALEELASAISKVADELGS